MLEIKRMEEPDFWTDFKRKNPKIKYSDCSKVKNGLETIKTMRNFLIDSQNGLCAYCCCRIDIDESLIEHLRPQAQYPNQTMDYENMVANCRSEGTELSCSAKKGDNYEENLFVSPLEEGCNKHSRFFPNGDIDGITEKGIYMINLLGLNCYRLQRARKAQIKTCSDYHSKDLVRNWFLSPINNRLESFKDAIEYLWEKEYYEEHNV